MELNGKSFIGGFKDPRTLLCFESWKPYLPKNFIFVGIFRHPLKVAESLKKRNRLSNEQSLNLWKIYNQNLLNFLEKFDGFLIDFDWPKEKLFEEINQIIKKLGLTEKVDLEDWYTGELIRSDKTFNKEHPLPKEVSLLYSKLKDRCKENEKLDLKPYPYTENQLKSIIDQLRLEIQKQGKGFKKINDGNSVIIKNKSAEILEIRSLLQNKERQVTNLQSSHNDLEQILNEIQHKFTWKSLRKFYLFRKRLHLTRKGK